MSEEYTIYLNGTKISEIWDDRDTAVTVARALAKYAPEMTDEVEIFCHIYELGITAFGIVFLNQSVAF